MGSGQLLGICIVQFTKVVSQCSQPQRFSNFVVMLYERLREKAPKLFALTINDSKLEHHACERRASADNIIVLGFYELLGRSLHRVKCPLVILTRSINGAHDRLIALN